MYRLIIKRILDVVVSFLVLIILSPIIIITYVILIYVNKGKPFFFQDRPGKDEQKIKIIKFKSMTDERDANGNLLPDIERMTAFGNFVRKTSIDELPQLVNVLIGDMSLVGPRPLLFKYIPLYTEEQRKRHKAKPGITGWAQINGRNSISWTEKFKLDVYYTENISFWLDLKILWFTFLKVIKSEGVNQSEDRPMLPFNGKN
jgi:undecaprenyl phosphate N,N'-diacetylbacillosamine 1-phosphate transferase